MFNTSQKKTKKKTQLSPLPHPTPSWLNPNCLAIFRMLFWMFFGDRRNMEQFWWAQWLNQLHEVCACRFPFSTASRVLETHELRTFGCQLYTRNWTSCLWQHVSRRARFTFVEVQDNFMMQPQVATNAFPRCFNETYDFYHWSRSCHDDVDDSEWCIFVDLSEHFFQIFPMRWKYPQRRWLRSGATMDLHTRKHAGCRPDSKPKRELRMLTHVSESLSTLPCQVFLEIAKDTETLPHECSHKRLLSRTWFFTQFTVSGMSPSMQFWVVHKGQAPESTNSKKEQTRSMWSWRFTIPDIESWPRLEKKNITNGSSVEFG